MKRFLPVTGKTSGMFFFTFFLFLNVYFGVAQTVTTDKGDYAPGETVIITGTDWQPGEEVELHVHHAEGDPEGTDPEYHQPWLVTADSEGAFTTTWYVPTAEEGDALGATLNLEAHGNMGSEASWTFTDSGSFGYNTTSGKSNTVSLSPGGSNNSTLGVTVDAPKNNGTIDVSLTFINTGSPSITIGTGTSQINLTSSVISFITGSSGIAHDFPISVSVGSSVASGSYSFKAYANGTGVQSAGGWDFTVVVGSTAGSIGTVSISSQSGSSTYGTASSPTFAVTSTRGSNGSVNGTYSVSGLPAGVTSGGFSPSATFNSTGGDPFSGATLTLNVDAGVDAGSYYFDIFLTDGASQASTQGTLVVNKRNLEVTADAGQTKVYGEANPAAYSYTVTSGSLASGDSFAGALTRDGGETVGDYAINKGTLTLVEGGTNKEANYDVTYVSNDFAITVRAITITADAGQTKVYGEANPAAYSYTVTSGSLASGDSFAGALTRDGGETVGDYAINKGTLTLVEGGTNKEANYDVTYVSNDFAITARAITITADAGQTKVYGEANPAAYSYTVTSGSLASGDSFAGALTRDGGETVGDYAINKGTLTLVEGGTNKEANYDVTYVSNDFAITVRAITITADAGQTKVYGEANPAAYSYTVTSGSLASGDSFAGALTRDGGETVGDYAINKGTLTLVEGGTNKEANYDVTYVSNDFAITVRAITITADAGQTKVYGEANPAAYSYTVTSGSLASGDSFAGALTRDGGETVGDYAINKGTLTLVEGGTNKEANYDVTYVSNDFAITVRAITITADAGQTKVYGEANPAAYSYTVTSGSLASGDSFAGALTRDGGETVGDYAINKGTLTLVEGGTNKEANYDVTYVSNDFAITVRAITITADAGQTKVYGEANPAAYSYTVTSGSLASGDSFAGALTRDGGETVGDYAINKGTLTLVEGGTNKEANYDVTYVSNDFAITARAITITADAGQTKVYGEANPAAYSYTVTSGSLASGDSFAGALTRDGGETVGDYAINKGTLTLVEGGTNKEANYDVTYVSNDFAITVRAITITADAGQTKVYGEANPAAYSYTVTSGSLASGDSFAGVLTRDGGETVGDYAINKGTLTLVEGGTNKEANYDVTYVSNDFAITARAITITADAGQYKYCGQAEPNFTYTSSEPLIAGNSFSGSLEREVGEGVGLYFFTLGSLSAGANYSLTLGGSNTFEIKGVSIDASESSNPVAIGSTATLSALVTDENGIGIPDVAVSFILTYVDDIGDEQTLPLSYYNDINEENTGSNGIVTITNVNLPYVKVYKVTAIAGEGCSESVAYLPVYDPSAGFVTGGGWIMSPAGAYSADETLYGKANFGFVAKYKKGKNSTNEVDGNTEFQFKAGNLNFKSQFHESGSLVISGGKATYRGEGTINGSGSYKFTLVAFDGDWNNGTNPDRFRIKIWGSNGIVYDNAMGKDDNSNDATELGGGSIVIHEEKAKGNS